MQNLHNCSSFFTLESQQLGLIPETTKLPNLKGALQEAWNIYSTITLKPPSNFCDIQYYRKMILSLA